MFKLLIIFQLCCAFHFTFAEEFDVVGDEHYRFPYTVSLRYVKENIHFCTGIVIFYNWVLTAATCFDRKLKRAAGDIVVVHGSPKPHRYGRHFEVARIVYNPQFSGSCEHNLALVKVRGKLYHYIPIYSRLVFDENIIRVPDVERSLGTDLGGVLLPGWNGPCRRPRPRPARAVYHPDELVPKSRPDANTPTELKARPSRPPHMLFGADDDEEEDVPFGGRDQQEGKKGPWGNQHKDRPPKTGPACKESKSMTYFRADMGGYGRCGFRAPVGKGFCEGRLGGPVIRDHTGKQQLIGIVTNIRGNMCSGKTLAEYALVRPYIGWIWSVTKRPLLSF